MTKPPSLNPITSSLFSGHHYDPASRKLTLEFQNGDTWIYSDVPAERAEAFAGNASPGRYFGSRIKGQYPGRKL